MHQLQVPVNIVLLLCFTLSLVLVKMASQPASAKCPIDVLPMTGNICAVLAATGSTCSCGSDSFALWEYKLELMPFFILGTGHVWISKPVLPESASAGAGSNCDNPTGYHPSMRSCWNLGRHLKAGHQLSLN